MKALKEREHKVIYKDGDKVVKVFDETFSKADVLNEALNMARVEETGLRWTASGPLPESILRVRP